VPDRSLASLGPAFAPRANRQLDQVLVLPEVLHDAPFVVDLARSSNGDFFPSRASGTKIQLPRSLGDHHQCIVRHGSPEKRAQGDFAVFVGPNSGPTRMCERNASTRRFEPADSPLSAELAAGSTEMVDFPGSLHAKCGPSTPVERQSSPMRACARFHGPTLRSAHLKDLFQVARHQRVRRAYSDPRLTNR